MFPEHDESNALNDILDVIFQGGSLQERIVTALQSYFDESGDGGDFLLVAGFISTAKRWDGFRKPWRTFLRDDCNNAAYFHTKDWVTNNPDPERLAVAQKAVNKVKRVVCAGQIVSVSVKEFNSFTTPHMRKWWGDAYSFCCQMCIDRMSVIPQVKDLPGDIVYVFEKGGPNWKRADKQMERIDEHPILKDKYRYRDHIFLTKEEAPPLQAADILANLKWKTIRDSIALSGELHSLLKRLADNPKERPIWYDHFSGEKLATAIGDSLAYNEENSRT